MCNTNLNRVFYLILLCKCLNCRYHIHLALFPCFMSSRKNDCLVYSMNAPSWMQVAQRSLAEVRLTEAARMRAGNYSGGMKRRLSVAIAFIGDPKLVILDEPVRTLELFTTWVYLLAPFMKYSLWCTDNWYGSNNKKACMGHHTGRQKRAFNCPNHPFNGRSWHFKWPDRNNGKG